MKRLLSGWTRLWIVFAIATWVLVAWYTLTTVGLPPDPNPSDAVVCIDSWRAAGGSPDSVWLRDCPNDSRFLEAAHNAYRAEAALYPYRLAGSAVPGLLIPFYVMAAFLIAKWIWRGFRRPPHP